MVSRVWPKCYDSRPSRQVRRDHQMSLQRQCATKVAERGPSLNSIVVRPRGRSLDLCEAALPVTVPRGRTLRSLHYYMQVNDEGRGGHT